MTDVVELRHGRIYTVGADPVRIAVTHLSNPALDGKPVTVELTVAALDGRELDYRLRVGHRFRAGGEVWAVRGFDGVGTYDYTVRISPIGESERGQPVMASLQEDEEMAKRDFAPQAWAESVERVRRAEDERARRLFGDREPFAVPEEPTDA